VRPRCKKENQRRGAKERGSAAGEEELSAGGVLFVTDMLAGGSGSACTVMCLCSDVRTHSQERFQFHCVITLLCANTLRLHE